MKRLIWGLLIGLVQPIQAGQYSLDWYQKTSDKAELVQGFNNHQDINNLVAVETVLHEQQKVASENLLQAGLTRKQAQIYQFLGSGLEAGAGVIAHQAVQRQFGTLADLGAVADRATYLYQQILKAEQRLLGVPSMPPVIVASPNVGASASGTGSISTPSPAVGSNTSVTTAPAPAPAGRPQLPANLLAALTQKNNQAALNPVALAPAPAPASASRPPLLFTPATLAQGATSLKKPGISVVATPAPVPAPAVLTAAEEMRRAGINKRRGAQKIPLNDSIWDFKVNGNRLDTDQLVQDVKLVNGVWTYVEPEYSDSD
jgi:hypothetical protein